MTISGILGATGSDKPGDVFQQLILQLNEQADNILENDCTSVDFNFYAKDRLPQHVVELYDRFTKFIALFYKYLECNQAVGLLSSLKDLDDAPNALIKLYKDIYAVNFPDKTLSNQKEVLVDFINPENSKIDVQNFLRYVKDFYQLKSSEEAYRFFFKTFYGADVAIDYPKKLVHRCSEGSFLGNYAGYTGPTGGDYSPNDPTGVTPGAPVGVYYGNQMGLISGFSRLHDNKYYQNYSYLIDVFVSGGGEQIGWDSYKDYIYNLLHPAGMFVAGNYVLTDVFEQPGTTGTTVPVETPIIGNYTPYRFNTVVNLKDNENSTDLYPCGYNPYTSIIADHGIDSGGLYYKNEAGTTAHDPDGTPLGLAGHTGASDAAELDVSYFRIFHHPNSWSATVRSGVSMGNISLGAFAYLTAINTVTGSPNDAEGSSAGCGF